MTDRDDWPLGPALRAAREKAGLSARKAAEHTNGLVSSGRWYQLESGVQKTKGTEVPIGTTPETVVAAALAVSWDVDEALRVAGMTASESTVRAIEKKMFDDADPDDDDFDPDWVLYLRAVLDYIDRLPTDTHSSTIAKLLFECEYLAERAIADRPDLKAGIDATIHYGDRLNKQLARLRLLQRSTEHGSPLPSEPSRLPDEVLADPESYGLAANRGEKGVAEDEPDTDEEK